MTMTNRTDKIKYIIFAVTYALSCLTISTNQLEGYLSYGSTAKLLIKFALVFVFVLIAVLMNKNQPERILEFSGIYLNILLVFFLFDYFVTNISGTMNFYKMWWLSIIYVANAGLYLGLSTGCKKGFDSISRKFWLYFMPTYIVSFLLVFARKPNTYFEVNLHFGSGLISYFDYLLNQKDSEFLFNFVGNIVFFIPISFLTKAAFPKIKNYLIFIIGLIIPFCVEGYQYIFKCGSVDIDDIVFNLSGFIIGFAALLLEKKLHKKRELSD